MMLAEVVFHKRCVPETIASKQWYERKASTKLTELTNDEGATKRRLPYLTFTLSIFTLPRILIGYLIASIG